MSNVAAGILVLLVNLVGWADGPSLQEARERWLKGNYAEAKTLYEKLAKDAATRVPATIGLSKALQSQGEYDKALEVVDEALKAGPQVDLLARRAEILYLRGNLERAAKDADQAIALQPECFLARWVQGRIYWDRADFKKADDAWRWFTRTYNERSNKDKDIKDPDELYLVGQAGAEYAGWHSISEQFKFILTEVYGDALRADKNYWPAEYAAGLLLLEKYNRGEALSALDKALAINPNAAEVLTAKGVSALQRFEARDAEQFADRALRINPRLVEALRLRADLYLMTSDTANAMKALDKAKQVNPIDEATVGRICGCLLLEKKTEECMALIRQIGAIDPQPGLLYLTLASCLEDRKHYKEAEVYYKKAIAARPMIPAGLNSVGMLYMRLGKEKEAREVLSRAFKADEFNVRVSNSLKVLRHLEKYDTLKTIHFEIRYDPKEDLHLAKYMANFLEHVYDGLKKQFQYEPPVPVLVEVFNNHDMFSGRTIALPDLHTIGASTGRIVAMVSPNSKTLRQPFNWARVLNHEMVHVFNLEQTTFLCPHWFTEGLAVISEGYPRPATWNDLLKQRFAADNLLDLDSIDLGFIRPRSPLEWNLAYCQAQLYIQYIRETYGAKAIAEMLAAYGAGLDTTAALQKVCQVSKPDFEKGYKQYLAKVVEGLHGKIAEKVHTYSQLLQEHDDHPEDLDIASQLAEQFLLRKDRVEARKLVDAVLAKKPEQPVAAYVKARLLLDAGDEDPARALLEKGLDRKNPNAKVVQLLGKLYYEAKAFDKAADLYELQHAADPAETRWLIELGRAYTQLNKRDRLIAVLTEFTQTDPDDLAQRKKLAGMLLEDGRMDQAERFAREALEIDVRDKTARSILEKALTAQKKTDELAELKKILD
ncbi:MAG TPA: tetratricopeptide repeat protein [Gemmataceae bacterium]|jgi:tetratricopeptide (TPR) repeat protein|nr:tetratricopeptide repeat protein [Gemmataceae bacterium]